MSQVIGIFFLEDIGYTLGVIVESNGFESWPILGHPDEVIGSPWLKRSFLNIYVYVFHYVYYFNIEKTRLYIYL